MRKLIVALMFFSSTAHANEVSGNARVIDGDTIHICLNDICDRNNRLNIRLANIDAPESNFRGRAQFCTRNNGIQYNCGDTSKEFLSLLINNNTVSCNILGNEVRNRGENTRKVGICYVNNVNINSEMVRQGHAVYENYNRGHNYIEYQTYAQQNRLGIWQDGISAFQKPSEFRKSR